MKRKAPPLSFVTRRAEPPTPSTPTSKKWWFFPSLLAEFGLTQNSTAPSVRLRFPDVGYVSVSLPSSNTPEP